VRRMKVRVKRYSHASLFLIYIFYFPWSWCAHDVCNFNMWNDHIQVLKVCNQSKMISIDECLNMQGKKCRVSILCVNFNQYIGGIFESRQGFTL
jgi:hypothetical protein